MQEIKISLFKPGRNGKIGVKPHPTDFYSEMQKIKDGTHWEVIKKLRTITDPIEKREYKVSKLEAFTISAVCPTKREMKGAIPSGLLAIDLDPEKNPDITDWGAVRDMLFELEETVASFLSASGKGVCFVVKINPKQLKDVFYSIKDELSDNFGLNLDAGCHDIVRLRFATHDHDAKINENYDAIPIKTPSYAYLENKRLKDSAVIEYTGEIDDANCLRAWTYAVKSAEQKVGVFADGSKHAFLASLAGFCNTIGMSQNYCESMVQSTYGALTDIGTSRLILPIANVYKTYKHKFNTFEATVKNRRQNSQIVGEVVKNVVRKGIKLTPEVVDEIAQKLELNADRVEAVATRVIDEYSEEKNADAKKENAKFKQFWYVDEESKVNISKIAFRDFLIAKGVFRLELGEDWYLVQITDNIVEKITKAHLKHIVMSYIEDMKEFEVWEVLANRVGSVFADDYLELIPVKEVEFHRDSAHSLSLYFLNGVVQITKEDIVLIPWNEFDGLVWKTKILKRNIILDDSRGTHIKSDFVKFLANISKSDDERFKAIVTSLGYLLHSYKDKSILPVVILNDEVISDTPQGGTGKGILVDALKRFKNVCVLDGKSFNFDSPFKYQSVNEDTDLIYFDDVKKNFPFELLFSVLTEGIETERKGQHRHRIPFERSPKMILSTNYAIMGEGNSNARRKHELEIAQYYSKLFTPKDEFKKLLFDDWNEEEWNAFDNFIARCCAVYMSEGLLEQKLINQPLKQLIAAVSKEFVDFFDEDYPFTPGRSTPYRVDQGEAYKRYMSLYPSKLGAKTFYNYMEKYYRFKEVDFIRKKSGDTRYFYLGEKQED